MISRMTGGKALPREITNQIVERTDGVPLFIEEANQSQSLRAVSSRMRATATRQQLQRRLWLFRHHFRRRCLLALTAWPTREVAQIGAALGRSFSHEVISAVAECPKGYWMMR